MATLTAAIKVDFEQVRLTLLLNKAMFAMKDAGDISKDFVSMPVIHTDSFEIHQFSHIYPNFLERGAEIVVSSSKNKKDIFDVESHMYIAEGRFDIDAFRDSTYFTGMKNMITSMNAVKLQQVEEKRTIRKLFESLTYHPTLGDGVAGVDTYKFIEDDGDNATTIAPGELTDPLVVLEGAKWTPSVLETAAVTFTIGEDSALTLKKGSIDAAVLVKEIIQLRTDYDDRAALNLQKPSDAMLSVLRVAPSVFQALLELTSVLGNSDVTTQNINLQTGKVTSLEVGGFTVIKGTSMFAFYNQSDDKGAKESNLLVNMPNRKVAYTYNKTTFKVTTSYVIALAYTSDALIHASVMPIRMRTAREDLQQLSVKYFETSSDTFIINAGEVLGIIAKGAA